MFCDGTKLEHSKLLTTWWPAATPEKSGNQRFTELKLRDRRTLTVSVFGPIFNDRKGFG